jgi:hypothetical protein
VVKTGTEIICFSLLDTFKRMTFLMALLHNDVIGLSRLQVLLTIRHRH